MPFPCQDRCGSQGQIVAAHGIHPALCGIGYDASRADVCLQGGRVHKKLRIAAVAEEGVRNLGRTYGMFSSQMDKSEGVVLRKGKARIGNMPDTGIPGGLHHLGMLDHTQGIIRCRAGDKEQPGSTLECCCERCRLIVITLPDFNPQFRERTRFFRVADNRHKLACRNLLKQMPDGLAAKLAGGAGYDYFHRNYSFRCGFAIYSLQLHPRLGKALFSGPPNLFHFFQ
ncbi:hypothetical protein D3C75_828750 [compost metagenome]